MSRPIPGSKRHAAAGKRQRALNHRDRERDSIIRVPPLLYPGAKENEDENTLLFDDHSDIQHDGRGAAGLSSGYSELPSHNSGYLAANGSAGCGAATVPSPTPAPTPVAPQLPLTAAPALAGPKYSPALMDFGTVDYKASSQRTFSITAPTAGAVTLQMPKGMFLATELRRIAPAQVGRGSSAQALRPAPAKPIPVQADNFFSIYQLNFAAGEEMQLD